MPCHAHGSASLGASRISPEGPYRSVSLSLLQESKSGKSRPPALGSDVVGSGLSCVLSGSSAGSLAAACARCQRWFWAFFSGFQFCPIFWQAKFTITTIRWMGSVSPKSTRSSVLRAGEAESPRRAIFGTVTGRRTIGCGSRADRLLPRFLFFTFPEWGLRPPTPYFVAS